MRQCFKSDRFESSSNTISGHGITNGLTHDETKSNLVGMSCLNRTNSSE